MGSSSRSTFGSVTSALATSKSCRSASVSAPAGASGNSSRSRSNSRSSRRAHRLRRQNARALLRRRREVEVVLHGLREDERRVLVRHRQPQPSGLGRRIAAERCAPDADRPRSGSTNPLAIPRRVDFPEPFSPTSAWTSPARQSKLTSVSARTAPNCRETPAQLEDAVPGRRPSSVIALAHPSGYINARTSSGTSDVFDTVGVTRSGLQSDVGHLAHHVRHDDLRRDLRPLELHHRCRHGRPRLEVAARRVADVEVRVVHLLPVAEQRLLVGPQRDRQVVDRDAEVVVGLQRGVEPVGVLVRVPLDVGVGRQPAVHRLQGDVVDPVRVRGTERLDRRRPGLGS